MVSAHSNGAALADLRGSITGRLLTPDDRHYEDARGVWNAMVDGRPAVMVRAGSVEDVIPTVAYARATGLDLAVRGGGHNVAGLGTVEGGVVLDLGALSAVHVDPVAQTVHVQGGATLADVDAATAPHGLAVPCGVVSGTGIGGLTLGGGVGWLTRKHGLTADNLLAAEVITADGRVITASASENPDLLWALKGGGGNFGVVTGFTFRAHRLGPEVLVANLVYSLPRWRDAWRALAEWTSDLPDAMTMITTTMTPPPFLEMGEDPLLIVGCAWAEDDHALGLAEIDRMRKLCPADEELVGPQPWVQWQSAFDPAFPKGVRAYWRNTSLDRLDEQVIDVLIRRGAEQTWVGTAFDVHHMGGAFARVDPQTSPFPHREARYWVNIYGFWTDPGVDQARVGFVRGMSGDLDRFATGGHYVNFQGREEDGHRNLQPVEVFGPDAHERLVSVKRSFDPDNVFHINHNIAP